MAEDIPADLIRKEAILVGLRVAVIPEADAAVAAMAAERRLRHTGTHSGTIEILKSDSVRFQISPAVTGNGQVVIDPIPPSAQTTARSKAFLFESGTGWEYDPAIEPWTI